MPDKALLDAVDGKQALLLIHGYNNDDDRTQDFFLQIRAWAKALSLPYDVILGYAWPGKDKGREYFMALNNVLESAARLRPWIEPLIKSTTALDIMTHSLGGRVALQALNRPNGQGPSILSLVLTAPAVRCSAFGAGREFDPERIAAERIAVLHSIRDRVLRKIFVPAEGGRALGCFGPDLLPTEGSKVSAVNCDDLVDGHGRYRTVFEAYVALRRAAEGMLPPVSRLNDYPISADWIDEAVFDKNDDYAETELQELFSKGGHTSVRLATAKRLRGLVLPEDVDSDGLTELRIPAKVAEKLRQLDLAPLTALAGLGLKDLEFDREAFSRLESSVADALDSSPEGGAGNAIRKALSGRGDPDVRDRVLNHLLDELQEETGEEFSADEREQALELIRSGALAKDLAGVVRVTAKVLGELPRSIVKTLKRLPAETLALLKGLAGFTGETLLRPKKIVRAFLKAVRGADSNELEEILERPLRSIFDDDGSVVDLTREWLGDLLGFPSVRLAVMIFARVHGIPLTKEDLEDIEEFLEDGELGGLLERSIDRLTDELGEEQMLTVLERMAPA